MPRLAILTAQQVKVFDKPPRFTLEQRKKYFQINEKLSPLLKNLRSETNTVCMVIQWGYFRATGRFFMINDFRESDVRYICKILDIKYSDVNLPDYRNKRKICRDHQCMILKAMNFQSFDDDAKNWLQIQLENLVTKQMQPREIIYHLSALCHQKQIEIPTYHYFSENISNLYNQVESDLTKLIEKNITQKQIKMLCALLNNNGTHPLIHQWKVFDQKLQVKHIQASIQLFLKIKNYFYELQPLLEILDLNKSSCEYYATWVSKAKVSQLIQMPDKNKLYLHLAAFAQHQFYARHDYLVDITLKSVIAAKNKAKKKRVARDQAERGERLALIQQLINEKEKLEALITEISKIIDESAFSDQKKIGEIKTLLKSHHAIQSKINIEEQVSNKTKLNKLLNDDTYYDFLESVSKSLQIRVSEIIKAVDFNADTSDKNIIEAINYYKKVDGEVDNKAPLDHLEKKHRDICITSDNKLRVSLYKILFFMRIMDCIKSGSLNLKYSYRYKAIQDYLTPKEKWMREKHQLLESAGLSHFTDVEPVLGKFKESLDERYTTVNENILSGKNKHIHFTAPGKFVLHTPSVEKKNIDSISDVLGETGFVPIIHVLNEINRVADFTDCFKHYSVKNQKLKPTPTTIFAGIMAKGHNIGVNKISHISVGVNHPMPG